MGQLGNPKMGCPGKWVGIDENLRFFFGRILSHAQILIPWRGWRWWPVCLDMGFALKENINLEDSFDL